LRIGTPEVVRLGMTTADMPTLASFIVRGLGDRPEDAADDVTSWRAPFRDVHYTTDNPA
jgi:glycine hydroxymethyltransferase